MSPDGWIRGERVIIVLANGDQETWTEAGDRLAGIELHATGGLVVHVYGEPLRLMQNGQPTGTTMRGPSHVVAVRSFGSWIGVQVVDEALTPQPGVQGQPGPDAPHEDG